ncbi:antibiotic biosynthesis monooxygenase [Solirubrobacter phytolaccae]|uniref:Antibiotic biosynthesis monooxygenase n=1 Tax=Solirubrobacter phytolaccae TaxID=1404360 RepID=A0A9X3S677_9ACTN|nr:antibiotic biosynthesis monooxygenase [Solirubrobacter phytolaccae]MDA0178758.1 antibiotic biosynthesis monooxygenase [Solirubrobacter phytolaccae]
MPDSVLAITRIHGIAGRRDELRSLMRATEQAVAQEAGCRTYRFAAMLDDPDEYVHVQEWTDETVWKAHQVSPAFRDYQRALFELLARPSDMEIHRGAQTTKPEPSGLPDPRAVD